MTTIYHSHVNNPYIALNMVHSANNDIITRKILNHINLAIYKLLLAINNGIEYSIK
jgi:hypothetical protein